jgi:uncharacterized membrane-anchored protein
MIKTKSTLIALIAFIFSLSSFAQTDSLQAQLDSIGDSLVYQTGTIEFPSCKAKMIVPEGFKYLDQKQSIYVLHDLWGNPSDSTVLGLLVPSGKGVMGSDSWAFTIEFDNIGYVKDNDAGKINYKKLLKEMQKEVQDENAERAKLGYEPVQLVGWASEPYYDKDKKVLHWAKELKFGEDSLNTLNYNLRVLGKDGVFVLNAVAGMNELNEVKPTIDVVLNSIEFERGSKYADFNPQIDDVAAWTIGGLVAGKVLAKAGIFAVIAKFGKVIAIALAGAGAGVWRFITGKKKETDKQPGVGKD